MSMAQGLDLSRVVSVSISLTAVLGGYTNFGSGVILGSTPGVIDVAERVRTYYGINAVANDFGTAAPEFLAAQIHFSQSPRPAFVNIGRWAQTATYGRLKGAILTPAQRLVTNFTTVSNGAMTVSIDGVSYPLTNLNFSGITNLNGAASVIQGAIQAAGANGSGAKTATVLWDGVYYRFIVTSGSTGATSSVSYATSPASGGGATDISILTGLSVTPNSAGSSASVPVAGIAAETALTAAQTVGNRGGFYCMEFAPAAPLADSDAVQVAAYIEATSRIAAFTTQNTNALDPTRSDDLASLLQSGQFSRSFVQFSSTSPYAATSLFARFATVDFRGNNTTITGMFKQEPGVSPEVLVGSQADALQAKNCNVFATYIDGTADTQYGTMANGNYIDQRINADWIANFLQVNVRNVLRTQPKVPQTDKGMGLLAAAMAQSCQQAVNNGYIAEGIWNGPPVGTLNPGDVCPGGFYIFVPKVALQTQADRQARKSVVFQIALKEAGAVHSASIIVNVNP
jgi:hypothetical protein